MPETLTFLPALTLQIQMQGLAALGLDMQRIRARVGPVPEAPDALVPLQQYVAMWEQAHTLYDGPGLPTALALEIPFGAFGALDYLVGSAATISGCCTSAVLYFAMVSSDCRLELDELEEGQHALRVVGDTSLPTFALEFTLAVMANRMCFMTDGQFRPTRIGLPLSKPASDPVRQRLFGPALVYDFPRAEILIDARNWQLPSRSADPKLHDALKQLARQFKGAEPGATTLEQALHARLRPALAQGRLTPAGMAALLGLSERTLQRRLNAAGHSFSDVLEDFRRDESARLLCDPKLHLVEVASRLGYAEQTSFTRAFRRWTGTSPGAWREHRKGSATQE